MAIDKHRGRWRARWRDDSGAQRARSFDRKADAQQWLAKVRVDRDSGAGHELLTVAELADRWLEASPHLSAGTLATYRRDLNRYILPRFGHRKADSLRADLA